MKAFKKLSAAAAVLVLLSGLVSAGAVSYADQGDITRTEAVSEITQLGILAGYDDGLFRPDGDLTRQETAKIFAVILGGDGFNPASYETESYFSDVDGLWGEGYINYLASLGFLSGDGTGAFDPSGNITARQMAKLVLETLGYDAGAFTGTGWDAKVDLLAHDIGIYNDFSGSLSQVLSRQDAALLIYNALDAEMINFSGTTFRDHYFGSDDVDSVPDDSVPLYALIDYTSRSTSYDDAAEATFYTYTIYFPDGTITTIKTTADISDYTVYEMQNGLMADVGISAKIIKIYDTILAVDLNFDGVADDFIQLSADPVIVVADGSFSEGAQVIYALDSAGETIGLWVIAPSR